MSNKPIARPSRMGAVWLTYRTRWLLALGGLCVLGLTSPAMIGLWRGNENLTSAAPEVPRPFPNPSVVLNDDGTVKHGKTPDWSKLKSLSLFNGLASCAELWEPGAMPKLESLTIYDSIHDHQLIKLCELYDLKVLSLYSCYELTDLGMARLAEEPNLEYLHVGNGYMPEPTPLPGELPLAVKMREEKRLRTLHFAPELKWPASLKILDFDDTMGTPDVRLQEFQRLPKLHTLITRLYPRTQSLRLSDETYELVNGIPALRRLYLTAAGPHSPRHVEIQQAALPRLTVRPAHFNRTLGQRAGVMVMLGMGIVLLLANQLSAQFITPASQLTPGYSRPHLLFTAAISLFVVVCSTGVLCVIGCSLLQAASMSVLPIFVLALGAKLLRRSTAFPLPGFTNPGFIVPFAVFPVVAVQATVGFGGSELDWFLKGHYPLLAWTLIAGAIWGVYDLATWHLGIVRDLEEGGMANAPLGMLDLKGWTEWGTQFQALRQQQGKRTPIAMRGRDRDIERLIESLQQGKPVTSHQLWQLGQPQTAFKFALIMTIAMLTGVGGLFLVRDYFNPGNTPSGILTPIVFQSLLMGLLMTPMIAWQRRPMFATELLRPNSRQDWKSMWFRGIAWELTSVLLVSLIAASLLYLFGTFSSWTVWQLAIGVAGTISLTVLAGVTALWVLANESPWRAFFGVLILVVILIGVIMPVALLADAYKISVDENPEPILIGLVIVLPGIASAIVYNLARRRWDQFEVGRIS